MTYAEKYPDEQKYREMLGAEAITFYRDKMMELIDNDPARIGELRGYVPGKDLPNHLMYRLEPILSPDGHRTYEFLIECNTKVPAEGIYYGVRGLTNEGYDPETELRRFQQDWDAVKAEVCTVLNNIFTNKDFSHRFKMTDNYNTNAYWLTWISLTENEDIRAVGLRAIHYIRSVFARYLSGEPVAHTEMPKKPITESIAFMNTDWEELLRQTQDPRLFKQFIQSAEEQGWIAQAPLYEKGWIWQGEEGHRLTVDFIALIVAIREEFFQKNVPWTLLESLFLDSNGLALKNLRVMSAGVAYKNKTKFWEEKAKKICGKILSDK